MADEQPGPSAPQMAADGPSEPRTLATTFSVARANHSFSGLMFDVANVSSLLDVQLSAIAVGGSLGRVRVFFCRGAYAASAHRADLWECAADCHLAPSWDVAAEASSRARTEPSPRQTEPVSTTPALRLRRNPPGEPRAETPGRAQVALHTPYLLRAGETCGVYVHSAEPGDTGLVYHAAWHASQHAVLADDGTLRILVGSAHASSEVPFEGGWWRAPRALAGAVTYLRPVARWTPALHAAAPRAFRRAAWAVACGASRPECALAKLPRELLHHVLEIAYREWDFEAEHRLRGPAEPAVLALLQGFVGRACAALQRRLAPRAWGSAESWLPAR